jgi:hypothetical protein
MALFDMGITVDIEDVLYYMTSSGELGHEDILEFVKALDLAMADWDFTEKLYKHFKHQHKIFKAEL